MGRGRTKAKNTSTSNYDDLGSGEEEKIPAQKKRGRPQKIHKQERDEEEVDKLIQLDGENTKTGTFDKQTIISTAIENGKKRKSTSPGEEKKDFLKEGSMNGSIPEESSRLNGFRHIHNRRKNKPHRAAEAVVECL